MYLSKMAFPCFACRNFSEFTVHVDAYPGRTSGELDEVTQEEENILMEPFSASSANVSTVALEPSCSLSSQAKRPVMVVSVASFPGAPSAMADFAKSPQVAPIAKLMTTVFQILSR